MIPVLLEVLAVVHYKVIQFRHDMVFTVVVILTLVTGDIYRNPDHILSPDVSASRRRSTLCSCRPDFLSLRTCSGQYLVSL